MKKFLLGCAVGGLLSVCSVAYATDGVQALLFPVKFFFNGHGSDLPADMATLNYNGHAYVPIRFIAEELGASITYHDSDHTILVDMPMGPAVKSALGDGLPGKVGDPAKRYEGFVYSRDIKGINLPAKTGYGPPTGKWFLQPGGPGKAGYAISSGSKKAGSEVEVSLTQAPPDMNVRIRLCRLDKHFQPVSVVKEHLAKTVSSSGLQTLFSANLPSEGDALYLLSAEVLGPEGSPEDTLLSSIYVPLQEMNAEIFTDKDVYRPGETMYLTVKNAGPSELQYGLPYMLEKWEDHEWRTLSLRQTWEDIGIITIPGQIYEQPVPLPDLKSGKYRIIKELKAEEAGWNATLAAVFTVENKE